MTAISIDHFINKKRETKKALAKKMGFSHKKALLGIFLDKELNKNQEASLKILLDGFLHLNISVIVLADSNLELFRNKNVVLLPYNRINRRIMLEASDMALAMQFNDVEEMLLSGVIPVSLKREELSDYDPNHETGNSFIYTEENTWSQFAALVRAVETFKFPYDWKHIVREGISTMK